MSTAIILVLFLVASAAVQGLLPVVTWLGQAPFPLLLSAVLYYALHRGAGVALAAGFLAGLLQDALSPTHLGFSSLCFCAVGWGANRFRSLVIADSPLTPAFFGLVAGTLVTLALYLLGVRGDVVAYPWGRVALKSLGQGVTALISTPIVFGLLRLSDTLVGNVRTHEDIAEIDWSI